jgi:hypothetical protein
LELTTQDFEQAERSLAVLEEKLAALSHSWLASTKLGGMSCRVGLAEVRYMRALNWQHEDVSLFLRAKNWPERIADLKRQDFNFSCSFGHD